MNPIRPATSDAVVSDPALALSPSVVFDLLANDRRRYALHHLSGIACDTSVEGLAEQIAIREGDSTDAHRAQVLAQLHHMHLPKLVDTGVVDHDAALETVRLTSAATALAPHLQHVADADLP